MAKENSFDIVSEVEMQEIDNALNQTSKEIQTRYDFRGTKCSVKREGDNITILADDEGKRKAVQDVLESKMVRRKVPLQNLSFEKVEDASGGTVRQLVKIQQGIESEKAKAIVKWIKANSKKIQASIQSDQVRVASKKIDDLQELISALKSEDFGISLQFVNFR